MLKEGGKVMLAKVRETIIVNAMRAKLAMNDFKESERGDTNFISILIILGIVVILAGVFIGFKDQIIGKVEEFMGTFMEKETW